MPSLTVPAGTTPVRLDLFLASALPAGSRRAAQRAIADGAVRVNGRRARKGHLVSGGDEVQVADAVYAPPALAPNPQLPVRVLYEDAAVIAVDKPPGIPSHALRAGETDTVANFLLARHPELAHVGTSDREAGVVHRLDTETSGVLLAAHTPEAYAALRQQFSTGAVSKDYLALVQGDVGAAGVVDAPIAHAHHNRRKMAVVAADGSSAKARPAITRYRPVERFGTATLLEVEIPTGVMHQIRVHLASIGHPVIGDRLYGDRSPPGAPPRHLLHACRVRFTHPETRRATEISSPLAADFAEFLAHLRQPQQASGSTTRRSSHPRAR